LLQQLFNTNKPATLVRAAKKGELERVRRLLDEGVPVDGMAAQVFPLFAAAFYGHVEVVRLLRARGASLELTVAEDTTALHALAQPNLSREVCDAILEGATDVDRTTNGLTPLMLACQFNRQPMVESLLAHGAQVNAAFPTSQEVPAFPGDVLGFTPLLFALQNGHDELVPVLLDAGAELGARLAHGATELIVAASASGPRAIEALLAAGADPNQAIAQGRLEGTTALQTACLLPEAVKRSTDALEVAGYFANRVNVVRALLAGGAEGSTSSPAGVVARELAKKSGLLKLEPGLFDAPAVKRKTP
jgi:ankyrin repeat protein